MDIQEYKQEEKRIKRQCRARAALIMGGLAALLLGGKAILKKLDVDVRDYILAPGLAYPIIMATAFYYGNKEGTELIKLDKEYAENKSR
jgi:small neutral amino acid transporter SnatA (MarC family)